jgi:hypothetical protein
VAPQEFKSLQQKDPLGTVRHLYAAGQPSSFLQGAFAPGGVAPLEKQPAKMTRAEKQRTLDTVLE